MKDISRDLQVYIITKSLVIAISSVFFWSITGPEVTKAHLFLIFLVLFFNLLISHFISFLFQDLLPTFFIPILNLSIVAFNGFFLSAGLEQSFPINEIKILIALYLIFFSFIYVSFEYLLCLKFESFFSQQSLTD